MRSAGAAKVALAAVLGLLVVPGPMPSPAQAAVATITINDPGTPPAGTVTLAGSINEGPITVLYAMDASGSTKQNPGHDCDGDGTAAGAADDLNGDGSVGDTLDCEIGAIRALDASLATSTSNVVATGLEAFATRPAVADVDPGQADTTFVPPGFTGGDAQSRLVTAARSVVRGRGIQLFSQRLSVGRDTNLGTAVHTAIAVLKEAELQQEAGPTYLFLLSDGSVSDDDLTPALAELAGSGVRLRSFAISSDPDACGAGSDLARLSGATGETCQPVPSPGQLARIVLQPETLVNVTVNGLTERASPVGALGGWSVPFVLGAGTYTATAFAQLPSGVTVATARQFSVLPAAAGTAAPPPGTVRPGVGAAVATAVTVGRPGPNRHALPRKIRGRVGLASPAGLKATARLNGATIALQGRGAPGTSWRPIARAKVVGGGYTVTWKRQARVKALRVQLLPFAGFAASAPVVVPTAPISACSTRSGRAHKVVLTCHTTAKAGSKARLLDGKRVLDRARVAKGLVTVSSRRSLTGDVLRVDLTRTKPVRLHL